jgi:enoyl-[acyl-carrier protein] reductase I
MLKFALEKNPGGRLTNPEDIARTIVLLSKEEASWITGNIINVDGGEYVVNYIGEKVSQPIK